MGKKFIDKSKALTYRLVPKETGPDQFDDNQPKHTFVLVPNKKNKATSSAAEFLFQEDGSHKPEASNDRVFPSKGPRPDWDPDIVACLDDDFDFEDPDNALEDDFMAKANAGTSYAKDVLYDFKRKKCGVEEEEDDDESLGSDFSGDFSGDEFDDNNERFNFQKSSKSKLSQYSMTSAITNCTEDVQILNDRFDKLLDEYDDDQIGALDGEDIEFNGATVEKHAVSTILNSRDPREEELFIPDKCEENLRNTILQKAIDADEQQEKLVSVVVERKSLDCISLVGTCCSTAYQPAVIPVERLRTTSSSTVRSSVQTAKKSDENELRKLATIISCRGKNETSEQRRERKQLVKAARKESRLMKKEVKLAFKNERTKQSIEKANAHAKLGFKL